MGDLWVIAVVIGLADLALATAALYLLPALIGWVRRVPAMGSVVAINVLLGWTLIGWLAALAIVLRSSSDAGAAQIAPCVPAATRMPDLSLDHGKAGRGSLHPYRDGTPPPLELPSRPAGTGVGR